MAHVLCQPCQSLSFSLHEPNICNSLHCTNNSNTTQFTSLHSDCILHFPSLQDLEISAKNGCHLCILIHAGLRSVSRMPIRQPGKEGDGVYLWFECRTSAMPYNEITEDMYAACGSVIASFEVDAEPRSCCGDVGFYEKRPLYIERGERAAKFRSVCISDDVENGLQAGKLYDVFEVADQQWLARVVPTGVISHGQIGAKKWIDQKVFGNCTYPVHPDCSCGKGVWEPRRMKRLEIGGPHATNEGIMPLVRDWLTICDSIHLRCSLLKAPRFPARLIEVLHPEQSLRLVDGVQCDGKYATLSYKWGNTASSDYITTTKNIETRLIGFQKALLPHTVQDAITVSHWLGIKYIWIDAICIIQDSLEDWKAEGSRMDQIYSESYLTISADSATDANSGFLNQRNALALQSCIHPSLVRPYDKPTPGFYSGQNARLFLTGPGSPGLPVPQEPRHIASGVANAPAAINISSLNERGWILQERLLSRRILHWGEYEVTWECNESTASEREVAGYGSEIRNLVLWNWKSVGREKDWENLRNTLQWHNHAESDQAQQPPEETLDDIWHRLVQLYTARKLTVPTDRLPAVLGLSNAFRKSLSYEADDYFFGLWRQSLFHDLCWTRIAINTPTGNDLVRSADVPTFSWASINSPVQFVRTFAFNESVARPELLALEMETSTSSDNKTAIMKLRGLLFPPNMLTLEPPPKVKYDVDDVDERISWDIPGTGIEALTDSNIICFCIGITKYMDGFLLSKAKRLLGILLEPSNGIGSEHGERFTRVGFYDGYFPDIDIESIERRTVTII